jgi:hypothetical protein
LKPRYDDNGEQKAKYQEQTNKSSYTLKGQSGILVKLSMARLSKHCAKYLSKKCPM